MQGKTGPRGKEGPQRPSDDSRHDERTGKPGLNGANGVPGSNDPKGNIGKGEGSGLAGPPGYQYEPVETSPADQMEQLVRVIQAATQEPLGNGDNVADSLVSGARCTDGAARDDAKRMNEWEDMICRDHQEIKRKREIWNQMDQKDILDQR